MIAFSDMDGTFLDPHKRVLPVNLRALDALVEAGGQFVPCTGRPASFIPPELLAHPAVRYAVCANGATVTRLADGAVLRRADLGAERALALYRFWRDQNIRSTFGIFGDGKSYLARKLHDHLDRYIADADTQRSVGTSRLPFDEDPEELIGSLGHVERVSMYSLDAGELARMARAVDADPTLVRVSSHANNIEVSDAEATKGQGLLFLCGHLGIPVADSVAFGDHLNDVSMIRAAGRGVAMANGEQADKDAADDVCQSNEVGGVGRYLLGLLGRPAQEP